MIKQIKTFLYKNRFKNLLLFAFGFIIITLFCYFPNSRVISDLRSRSHEGHLSAESLKSAIGKQVRDFRITDGWGEDGEVNGYNQWNGVKLVVIDAGHGGLDPGTSGGGMEEKGVSLDVALKLNALLQEKGILTYMTRADDSSVNLLDRINIANEKKAALFLSIHCNWFSDPSLRGAMTLYYPSDYLATGKLYEKEYARIIQDTLVKIPGLKDQGLVERPGLAVLRHALMPTALVEMGFLSNRKDIELLSSREYRQEIAQALADSIVESLSKIN